jgi:hypothetical protein
VFNCYGNNKIKFNGNAREVFMPRDIYEFMDFYGISHTEKTAIFYKAVRKTGGLLCSIYNDDFIYNDCECKSATDIKNFKEDTEKDDIYVSNLDQALNDGCRSKDLAIIEVETNIDDVELFTILYGLVSASKVKVLREVPLEEWGVFGKILMRLKLK